MAASLAHRGPDDAGAASLVDARGEQAGVFAHRRLSVLDLSGAGHQPMRSPDGRFTLTYNGEIYNFRELRMELERAGATFRSRGDTEVLLLGWAIHGPAFVERLRGMFAFAIWDAKQQCGWLVRDPFGIKPLYVAEASGEVLFASELRALLASGLRPRRLSRDGIAAYLSSGSVPEPLTIVEGVAMVLAGTAVRVGPSAGGFRLEPPRHHGGPARFQERAHPEVEPGPAAAGVRDALRDSVAHHLVSDVPVAFFLSGGVDSSALVALGSELCDQPLETFTVTFAEGRYSEATPAAALARRFGTRHHEVPVSGSDLLGALPDAFSAMDQPSMDGINTFVVSHAVRERGIKVVLSGLGGDELFAGYPSFGRAARVAPLWRLSPRVRRLSSHAAGLWPGVRGAKAALLLGEDTPALAAYRASRMLFSPDQVHRLIAGSSGLAQAPPPEGLSLLQQVSWYETGGYMRNTLLRDSDVFSMAHGLELRVPLVDVRVAAAAGRVHDRLKLGRGMSKPLLVGAVRDLLPRAVWDRPKQGFTLPFAVFMREALRATVQEGLSPMWMGRVGLDPAEVRRIWAGFEGGWIGWGRPWALYTLVRWAVENDMWCEELAAPAGATELVRA